MGNKKLTSRTPVQYTVLRRVDPDSRGTAVAVTAALPATLPYVLVK